MKTQHKAVIFDLDGTLLDTLEDLADSTNTILARHGLPTHALARYRYFVGDGIINLILRSLPEDRATPAFAKERFLRHLVQNEAPSRENQRSALSTDSST